MKTVIMFFALGGSLAAGYLPLLWGGSAFSMSSIFFSAIGGFLGIWVGYNLSNRLGL